MSARVRRAGRVWVASVKAVVFIDADFLNIDPIARHEGPQVAGVARDVSFVVPDHME